MKVSNSLVECFFSILGKNLALTTTEFPTYILSTIMAVFLHQFATPVFLIQF